MNGRNVAASVRAKLLNKARAEKRDMDLLGFGLAEEPYLIAAFSDLCALDVDDGIRFDVQSIRAEEIRKEANYAGIRATPLWRKSSKP